MREDGPSVLAMVALVAVVVALVILVFFTVGYLFGRAFLQRDHYASPFIMAIANIFGIDSDGLSTAVQVVLLFLFVIWGALVFWTYADARRRMDDGLLVICATIASLFPFVGTIVYVIVRPPEFLDDVRLRELEMQAAETRLHALDYQLCPHCDFEVKSDFLRCPNCQRRLKDPCRNCSKPLDPYWKLCPYCEFEVAGAASAAPPGSSRRRRRETSETATVDYPPPA